MQSSQSSSSLSPFSNSSSSITSLLKRARRPSPYLEPKIFESFKRFRKLTRNRQAFVNLIPFLKGRTAHQRYITLNHICNTIDRLENELHEQNTIALNYYSDLLEGKGGKQLLKRLKEVIEIPDYSREKYTPPDSPFQNTPTSLPSDSHEYIDVRSISKVTPSRSPRPLPIPPPRLGTRENPIIIDDSDDEILIKCRMCGEFNHERWTCPNYVRLPEHPGFLFDKDFIDSGKSRR